MLQVEALAATIPAELREQLEELRETARQGTEQVRRIARQLRPEALEDLGLPSALTGLATAFADQTRIGIDRRLDAGLPLPEEQELVVYRVAQKALTNVARHAEATRVELRLEHDDEQVVLTSAACANGPCCRRAARDRATARWWHAGAALDPSRLGNRVTTPQTTLPSSIRAQPRAVPVDDRAARAILTRAGLAEASVGPVGRPAFLLRDGSEGSSRTPVLDFAERERIELAQLPMRVLDENAAIVNALRRQATVIAKKSLEEGFGLGATEAMWKRRPVVASRVGGHRDQIQDGIDGVLVDDPRDLAGFGRAVADLLLDPDRAKRVGAAAQQRVTEHFLPDRYLAQMGRATGDAPGAMS